ALLQLAPGSDGELGVELDGRPEVAVGGVVVVLQDGVAALVVDVDVDGFERLESRVLPGDVQRVERDPAVFPSIDFDPAMLDGVALGNVVNRVAVPDPGRDVLGPTESDEQVAELGAIASAVLKRPERAVIVRVVAGVANL